MPHPIFVYGTLLRGESNHDHLASASFLRATRTHPTFRLHDLGPFPALATGGTTSVHGELYAVDDATLRTLDRLEGHPTLYRRTEISLADGRHAYTYVMPSERAHTHAVIASGDWREHRSHRDPTKATKYFAYGSNLDTGQMKNRCPGSRPGRCATLADHALVFVGHSRNWKGAVANVAPSAGRRVPGLLYDITDDDLALLDGFEGHPKSYRREERIVVDDAGREVVAHVYIKVSARSEVGAPSPAYLEIIRRSYRRLAFDESLA